MLIKRLYLRNFRVYEDELDLEIPPGLVGIYGPNGSGKSTLLEAILFCLWGKARTTKEYIRSAGVGGECVTEVEFEHEGHLYLVRRLLKGINSAISVEAHCDGALMSTGIRDVERYVESLLGMDDGAFRASVFTEQKQLAAFSDRAPGERRKLVLQLLGITPLDGARDAARKDARELADAHKRVRGLLPDLDILSSDAADADAKAAAAEVAAADEARAAAAAETRAAAAGAKFDEIDRSRQEYEALYIEGRAARQELDTSVELVEQQRSQLAELAQVSDQLAELEPVAAGVDGAERELGLIAAVLAAATAARRVEVGPEPPVIAEAAIELVRRAATEAGERLAGVEALVGAAAAERDRAKDAYTRSSSLSGEADCPVCGQALGNAFETVQAHRARELAETEARLVELTRQHVSVKKTAAQTQTEWSRRVAEFDKARQARETWVHARRQRAGADQALAEAWAEVVAAYPARRAHQVAGLPPGPPELSGLESEIRARVKGARAASGEVKRLQGRLEARPALERSLEANIERSAGVQAKVELLREKVRALSFDKGALDRAAEARQATAAASRQAQARSAQTTLEAARERERAKAAADKLADGKEKHAAMADVESDVLHTSRVAELLAEFRNTVVASVGPRLALQAADLFAELTDHEYDKLDVDPETYQLQISDGGFMYGLERFSGSEVDLANLALRVAISEHIHFQSGGSVGLLVLDEVFGPLDEDRKQRMLQALERLKGRFRQVLVVTHDNEIKEQLPNAIEVVKLPGRRATARVMGD